MPVGILRLNDPHPQPSSRIVFIKALPGPDSAYAYDFLSRIAAICHPILTNHHHSITTLEEHEPNREFIGRNFNGGEIIQLVLKSQRTGRWLSFRTVQMVMVHEMAHCAEMNHSRAFWAVRNRYADDLRALWAKGYLGDGLWGKGRTLLSADYHGAEGNQGVDLEEAAPESLCGGVYSRRGRRRKGVKRRRDAIGQPGNTSSIVKTETYAEKQVRRVKRKFGENGQSLGGDEATRVRLEKGAEIKAKPRVANSSRGRELRVAAALARFGEQASKDTSKTGEPGVKTDITPADDESDRLGSEDSSTEASESETISEGALTRPGIKSENHRDDERELVRICGDEDQDDMQVKNERDELRGLEATRQDDLTTDTADEGGEQHPPAIAPCRTPSDDDINITAEDKVESAQIPVCPVCSLQADPTNSTICSACGHILDTNVISTYWKCETASCRSYNNHADYGACGLCGGKKP